MSDEAQRQRFCKVIDANFSVIAPAGVGKTYSIVERIATLACEAPALLKGLYVITYTKKAAEALRSRCEARLSTHPQYSFFARALQQSFFGTIHSLCWHHIQTLEPQATYELIEDDTPFREAFLAEISVKDPINAEFKDVLRFVDLDALLPLTEHIPPFQEAPTPTDPCPALELSAIYNYSAKRNNAASIAAAQQWTHTWEQRYADAACVEIPQWNKGGEGFKSIFYKTFLPLYTHLGPQTLALLKQLSTRYFRYRCQHGVLKYTDFIFKAQENLKTSAGKDFFAGKTLTIILDEAQDTDAHQFGYIQTLLQMNPNNRFSMVGDPQQAIYGSRVDVQDYLNFHKQAIQSGLCQPLVFSKTFRCPVAITERLNQQFPKILNPEHDPKQVSYVPLKAASSHLGQWEWIAVPSVETEGDVLAQEVQVLSTFLKKYIQHPPCDLSQICLLCPRKEWLSELQRALTAQDLPLQLYSSTTEIRSNPLFCACLALIHRINYPYESFEEIGLLRNVFHHSERFLMEHKSDFEHGCLDAQRQLNALRQQVLPKTLCDGMAYLIRFFQTLCAPANTDEAGIELLMDAAFKAQKQQLSWWALEKRLLSQLSTSITLETHPLPHTLQGYSCHKAKGLEWHTVILPFFYRPIRYKTQTYPQLFHEHVFWNKYDPNYGAYLAERKRELQRLLYVTLTRAKCNLFILNDKALWPKTADISFGRLYEAD